MRSRSGFTLVELIVVLAIVSVLATLGFVSYVSYIKDGNDFKRISDVTMIKSQLEIYKKNHSLLYPSGSGATQINSGATFIAQQYLFDDFLAGKTGISKVPLDPKTKTPYVYSVRADLSSYQITATLENNKNLVSDAFLFSNTANAANGGTDYTAYVDGTFMPSNKASLPGLIYAVSTGSTFTPGNPLVFDISTPTNLARVVLNGQNTNLAYDMQGQMVGNDGTATLSGILATVSLVQNTSSANTNVSCSGVLNPSATYLAGVNEVWPYMSGTTVGTQVGWKYKTCNSGMKPTTGTSSDSDWYYVCANISGGQFDASCHWTGCMNGYTAVAGTTPTCKANLLAPTGSYPQSGAFNLPVSGNLAWNTVSGSNGTYTAYMDTSSNPTTQVYNGSNLTVSYSSLANATTYYWKVKTCDAGGACQTSPAYSFTTVGTASSGTGGGTVTTPTNNYCPTEPEVPCSVPASSIAVTYVGCSNVNSSNLDCASVTNSYGTSERNLTNDTSGDSYYGQYKIVSYRIANSANGSAYFKIRLGTNSGAMNDKASTDNFESDQAVDYGGEKIANNLYWKLGSGCYTDATKGYRVSGQSSCWINIYGRSDMNWPTVLSEIGAFQVYNTDTVYGAWSTNPIAITGKTAGYSSTPLTWNFTSASHTGSDLDGTGPDFGASTRIGGVSTYGNWKSLTYTITNPNTTSAYFRNFWSGTGTYATIPETQITLSALADSPDTNATFDPVVNSWKVLDIGADGLGNVIMKNGDTSGASPCNVSYPGTDGFKILPSSSCKVTFFFRADAQSPTGVSGNMAQIRLLNQTISWNTPSILTLAGYGSGWWIYITNYVLSELAGWIQMNVAIRDYNLSTYVMTGYGQSETLGWICFSPSCGANVTRDWNTGQLTGYALSELAGWIDVSGVSFTSAAPFTTGYAQSELFGWISFN